MMRKNRFSSIGSACLACAIACTTLAFVVGCSEPAKQAGTSSGSSPSLDSTSADERAAAAREAAKKYGTGS
jgi:hypothetical protein